MRVEDLGDFVETAESDLVQDVICKLSQHHNAFFAVLFMNVVRPDSNDLPACACVIRADNLNDWVLGVVAIERLVDALDYVSREYEEFVVKDRSRRITVHAEAKQPLANFAAILVVHLDFFDLFVDLDKLLIVLNDGLIRFWVVEDTPIAHQIRQIGVLDLITNGGGFLEVLFYIFGKENLQRGRLDRLGDIDYLLKARHAQSDIH